MRFALGLKADLTAAVKQEDVLACAKAIGALRVTMCDVRPRQCIQDIVTMTYKLNTEAKQSENAI